MSVCESGYHKLQTSRVDFVPPIDHLAMKVVVAHSGHPFTASQAHGVPFSSYSKRSPRLLRFGLPTSLRVPPRNILHNA